MQQTINKREEGKGDGAIERIVDLERLDARGERALQALLLIENPGEEAPSRGLSILSDLTPVASERCRLCCLSKIQAKRRPNGPGA
jgi:hypothetical protein